MHVTVFGANGKVGSQVTQILLERGCTVTAFVHGNSSLSPHPRLHILQGDVKNKNDVFLALEKATHIISTLGSWGTSSKDILSEGMKAIIPTAEQKKDIRIVSLTGADAWLDGEKRSLISKLMRCVLLVTGKKILEDAEKHLRLLQNSQLNWTVLRSPIMTNKKSESFILTETYPLPWKKIYRHHVATALVDIALSSDCTWSKKAPYIS